MFRVLYYSAVNMKYGTNQSVAFNWSDFYSSDRTQWNLMEFNQSEQDKKLVKYCRYSYKFCAGTKID